MIAALKERVRKFRRSSHDARLQRWTPEVDAFLVSYPKSGRTWLRYLVSVYLSRHADLAFEPDLRSTFRVLPNFDLDAVRGLPAYFEAEAQDLPLIAVSHRDFDPDLFGSAPVIMLLRDPRDVLVSSYFHQTRHKHRFEGTLSDFLECDQFGAASIAEYHNHWAAGLLERQSLVLSYEAMSEDTGTAVRDVLSFLGIATDEPMLREAIEKARFDRMQKKERETGLPGHRYDRQDIDASRVRRGKVAGYTDYLSPAEDERIRQIFSDRLSDEARASYRATNFLT